MSDRLLAVSETFYSIQGEGATMGHPSVFLRLKTCNLLCGGHGTVQDKKLHDGAEWRCDTIEVWMKGDRKEHPQVLSPDLIKRLQAGAHLIITGGEPLLQQPRIQSYLEWYMDQFETLPFIEVETNGTIPPGSSLRPYVNRWNCSPKLKNSGVPFMKRFRPDVISELNKTRTIFKFVITDPGDWMEIEKDFLPIIDRDKVWLMPGASDITELLEANQMVSQIALEQGVRFSTRLQIEIWNKTTGV